MTIISSEQISREDAERLSNRIGLRLDSMADNWTGALPLIREAIEREAFRPLGYASHGAYVSDRFGDSLSKLGVDLRREIVRELTDAGLSIRAIAPVVGVSHMTVQRDVEAGVTPVTPEPEFNPTPILPPKDTDWVSGPEPTTPNLSVVDNNSGEVIDFPVTTTETHTIKTVVGLDGKNYTKPETKTERRRSLVDDAFKANTDLWKAVERIRTITADDRFARNKADILAALQPSVDLALEILTDL